jgi:FixJ family two-component response regulator
MTTMPIVHVVDDDEPIRTAMARLLAAEGLTARTYASAEEFLSALRPNEPGCVVLDLQMPGLNGLELQLKLAEREDPPPVVFLTGHGQIPDSVRAIQRGAVDFLTKPVQSHDLLDAIKRAFERDTADRANRVRQRDLRARYARLTPREREVLLHLISGQLNKQAAADLSIAERTIKLHRSRILQKMETDSMAGLTRLAMELGIAPAITGK